MEKKKMQLPPDEQRCCQSNGSKGWRCKNYRMGHGAAADDATAPKTNYCEYHYNYYKNYKKKKKVTDEKEHADIQGGSANVGTKKKLPPDGQRCSQIGGGGWRCKNFRMGHGAAADDDTLPKTKFCEKHYNYYAEKKLLPPNDQLCCQSNGLGWRCKNFRMGHGAAADDDTLPKTKFCEKHYNYYAEKGLVKKKSSRNGDTIVSGGSAKIGGKRKQVERTQGSGELKSLTKTVVETRSSKRRKNVTEGDRFVAETSNQPATHDNCDSDTIVEGGSANNGRKRKYAERMSGELESLAGTREAVAELESLEHYKRKCFELSVELEKKRAECTELHGKLVEVETRKTTSTDENEQTLADATDRWKKLLSCLQSKENEKSTRGCGESRISNLESLVFRSGKESSILRCVELHNFERVESEVPGLQNDITQSCGKLTDESNRSTHNAEASIGGRKDSHVYECKAKEKVLNVCDVGADKHHDTESEFPKYSAMNTSSATLHLSSQGQNVEEGKGWSCSVDGPSQHGSSSHDHLEISTEPFANLVLDDGGECLGESEDFDSSGDSKNSLGDPMDMLAMKNWNRNKDEMKWKSEADMISSFEEDPEICLKAICALYRQEIFEDEISPKELFFHEDTLRCTTLAKFLMDKDCKGDVNNSIIELEMLDSKAVEDCKKLVRRYSIYLFDIYKNRKDPFFLPATTASSHGDQTSK